MYNQKTLHLRQHKFCFEYFPKIYHLQVVKFYEIKHLVKRQDMLTLPSLLEHVYTSDIHGLIMLIYMVIKTVASPLALHHSRKVQRIDVQRRVLLQPI